MRLPFLFARRYLLARRSQNAVNVITLISIVVMAVVTAAMVVVLSTLNGIAELVDSLYSPFDQDITITPAQGKTFERDSLDIGELLRLAGATQASWVIEENVLLRSGDQQAVATMKGVEPVYLEMSDLGAHLFTGQADLGTDQEPKAVLGVALKMNLDVPLDDGVFRPLEISAPVRGRKLSQWKQGAFEQEDLPVSGAFTLNMEFDAKYVLVPLELAARLLHYEGAVNALEMRLSRDADADAAARALREQLGGAYVVRTRQQKNTLMYSTNTSEKRFTFLVLVFIGLIGAFNIIASLTMLMIEKKRDVRTLSALGATPQVVRLIFLFEGLLIVGVGIVLGLLLGLGLCWVQQRFGLIGLANSVVDAYPVKVQWKDLVQIVLVTLAIGVLASWVPLRSLSRRLLVQAASATA
ncbi:MAG: ABC transporter permease [Flavobacteriales bacterium]|nr:ABC transporter permease [Flavobacteriales bacterium]